MPSWLIWVIVAIIVIAVIAAVVAASRKRKLENNRTRAGELREQAAAQATGLQQREAHARETEARAAEARAEAERKQAEADRLEAEAADRHGTAQSYREDHEQNLRRADELDPDVDHKADDYVPPTTEAERGTTPATEHGTDRVQDRLGGEGHETTRDDSTRHEEQPTTVTHPDGSTEAVRDTGRDPAYDDGQPSGNPSDPRLEGGSHRA